MTTANPRMPEILSALDRIGRLQKRQRSILKLMRSLTEMAMANEQDLKNEIAGLRTTIEEDQATDQQAVDKLDAALDAAEAQIEELKKQQVSVDFDGLITSIQEAKALIKPVTSTNSTGGSDLPPGETEVPTSGTSSFRQP